MKQGEGPSYTDNVKGTYKQTVDELAGVLRSVHATCSLINRRCCLTVQIQLGYFRSNDLIVTNLTLVAITDDVEQECVYR